MTLSSAPDEGQPIDDQVRVAAARLAAGAIEPALEMLTPLIGDERALAARFVLALTAWKMGRLDWSITLMRECHDRAPMNGSIAEALASLHAQSGNMVESVYVAKLATALGTEDELAGLVPADFPSFDLAFLAIKEQPLFEQARIALASGKCDEAIDKARQHLAIAGYDRDARSFYAAALLRAGKASEALDALAPLVRGSTAAPLASLHARCLAAVGEAAEALVRHDTAASLAPDQAALAASKINDGPWLDQQALAAQSEDWITRFCPPRKGLQLRQAEPRMVIAYLVAALADPRDAVAVAEVARAHDRTRIKVIAYGTGAQSWPENALLSGAFETWQDIGALDSATFVRFFAHDRVSVVVDASGFAAPQGLLALARLRTALRVSWLGNAPARRQPIYDSGITGAASGDWIIPGGYPVPVPAKTIRRPRHDVIHFGTEAILPQLDGEIVATWSSILRAAPEAKLLILRGSDFGRGVIDRLVQRFGPEIASRIDIVATDRMEDFYANVDVALAPRRGLSPRMAAEAIGCGVPVVAFAAAGPGEPYGAFLSGIGLGASLVAADAREYESLALSLAHSPAAQRAIAAPGHDAAHFARAIEEHAARALAECPPSCPPSLPPSCPPS